MSAPLHREDLARPGPAACGAGALVLSTAALAPLFRDGSWVPAVVAAVVLVALTGVLLRSLRVPLPLVVVGQAAAVAVLLTVLHTDTGVLGLLPGPAAVDQLRVLLEGAGDQVRQEAVPVEVTAELSVLLVGLVGLAAVVVDALVVGVGAPAGAGLVLLCLVAVPASLADDLLPWWSFVLGALALVLLLVADGTRRAPHAGPAAGARGLRSPAVVAVVLGAVLLGVGVGGSTTVVGTEGRLPSTSGSGGVGLNPFTQLRGQLDQPEDVPLFTVSGLAEGQYLRATSLDQFVDDEGWVLSGVEEDEAVPGRLDGGDLAGAEVTMTVEPRQYVDRWLPVAGTPREVRAVEGGLEGYSYDAEVDALHASDSRALPPYSVTSVVPRGSADDLRAAQPPGVGRPGAPDARYYATTGIDPAVADLAEQVVGDAPTALDAAARLTRYFTDPANGFTYDLSTARQDPAVAPDASDALVDFLTVGRRGFCEQFASSMTAMLRTLGIPSRVAVGFTATSGSEQLREVRTSDAHAWVEVFFPGRGWVVFDPTPLDDGRGLVPGYVSEAGQGPDDPAEGTTTTPAAPTTAPAAPTTAPARPDTTDAAAPTAPVEVRTDATTWLLRAAVVVAVLAVVLLVLAAPGLWRAQRRRGRRASGTAAAAWDELTDLARDRGAQPHPSESPRQAGRRVVREHGLDAGGRTAVETLVVAVEDAWYAPPTTDEAPAGDLAPVLDAVVTSFARCAPLPWRRRLLPLSLRRAQPTAEPVTAGRSGA